MIVSRVESLKTAPFGEAYILFCVSLERESVLVRTNTISSSVLVFVVDIVE